MSKPPVDPKVAVVVIHPDPHQAVEAPAESAGNLYQDIEHGSGTLFENAVAAQQQQDTLLQAAINQGVMQIYSIDTTAAAGAGEKVAQTGVADNLTDLLKVVEGLHKD